LLCARLHLHSYHHVVSARRRYAHARIRRMYRANLLHNLLTLKSMYFMCVLLNARMNVMQQLALRSFTGTAGLDKRDDLIDACVDWFLEQSLYCTYSNTVHVHMHAIFLNCTSSV
jgi:hypothetical protein